MDNAAFIKNVTNPNMGARIDFYKKFVTNVFVEVNQGEKAKAMLENCFKAISQPIIGNKSYTSAVLYPEFVGVFSSIVADAATTKKHAASLIKDIGTIFRSLFVRNSNEIYSKVLAAVCKPLFVDAIEIKVICDSTDAAEFFIKRNVGNAMTEYTLPVFGTSDSDSDENGTSKLYLWYLCSKVFFDCNMINEACNHLNRAKMFLAENKNPATLTQYKFLLAKSYEASNRFNEATATYLEVLSQLPDNMVEEGKNHVAFSIFCSDPSKQKYDTMEELVVKQDVFRNHWSKEMFELMLTGAAIAPSKIKEYSELMGNVRKDDALISDGWLEHNIYCLLQNYETISLDTLSKQLHKDEKDILRISYNLIAAERIKARIDMESKFIIMEEEKSTEQLSSLICSQVSKIDAMIKAIKN
uniref:COP9 signalosome complex subunit 4 n=1 Tax=Rhabditophanes sp. KR3021 TaxID=114890 RepID=A0AC35TJU3_9BILA